MYLQGGCQVTDFGQNQRLGPTFPFPGRPGFLVNNNNIYWALSLPGNSNIDNNEHDSSPGSWPFFSTSMLAPSCPTLLSCYTQSDPSKPRQILSFSPTTQPLHRFLTWILLHILLHLPIHPLVQALFHSEKKQSPIMAQG